VQLNRSKSRTTDEVDEDWMVSFADIVTLLLCFFVLFFSENKGKVEPQIDIIREITTEFSPVVPVENGKKSDQELLGVSSQTLPTSEKMMKEVNENLKSKLNSISGNNIDFDLQSINSKEVLLRVWNDGMFKSGSASLSPNGHNLVMEVAKTLSKYSGKIEIRIEGHADSRAIRSGSKIRNNLVLSSLRAASTANVFLEDTNYFNEKDLSVIGSGSKKQLVSDFDSTNEFLDQNADKNRRIDLFIISKSVPEGDL
jgi:chemotaxis protein MotB